MCVQSLFVTWHLISRSKSNLFRNNWSPLLWTSTLVDHQRQKLLLDLIYSRLEVMLSSIVLSRLHSFSRDWWEVSSGVRSSVVAVDANQIIIIRRTITKLRGEELQLFNKLSMEEAKTRERRKERRVVRLMNLDLPFPLSVRLFSTSLWQSHHVDEFEAWWSIFLILSSKQISSWCSPSETLRRQEW